MNKSDWENWAKALEKRISDWLNVESEKRGDGYYCKKCGKSLMNRVVYCSIHEFATISPHGGGGSVHTFYIPECPNKKCENHKPSFWDNNLHLDTTSNTLRGPCIDG